MNELYLPNLHWFAMNNIFTGSCGGFRFRAKPQVVKADGSKEVDYAASSILAEYWHGPFCYEKSEMEEARVFPMSQTGVEEMKAWLTAHI